MSVYLVQTISLSGRCHCCDAPCGADYIGMRLIIIFFALGALATRHTFCVVTGV
jgi:hypothetical protein